MPAMIAISLYVLPREVHKNIGILNVMSIWVYARLEEKKKKKKPGHSQRKRGESCIHGSSNK